MEAITVSGMRELEEKAFAKGVTVLELMERAGKECATLIESKLATHNTKLRTQDTKQKPDKRALDTGNRTPGTGNYTLFFCGPGNNGGEGFVCARYLAAKGYDVFVIVPIEPKTEAAKSNLQKAKEASVKIVDMDEAKGMDVAIVVDALLGIGARGALRGKIKDACIVINSMDAYKISIDVPTGMDIETGECDPDAVKPDATICIQAPKTGQIKAGKEKTGELWIADIGLE